MAGAKKTLKKIRKRAVPTAKSFINPLKGDIGESIRVPFGGVERSAEDVGDLFTPDIPIPEEETIIPIPDERTAQLEARRRRARRGGTGRESTILTEGLGG